jgi:hypothetical protein
MHCVNTTSQFPTATEHMSAETRRKHASHNDRETNFKKYGIKEFQKPWRGNKPTQRKAPK